MDKLTASQKRYLRALAHPLKPVVMLGSKGLTNGVLMEIERALDDHELIKLRLNPSDRKQDLERVQKSTQAQLVQRIGHVATLYRRNPENARIALPN